MKLTNVHKIPETFVNVLKRPTYSKGKANLSATQLLNSPKIVALTKKFEDELEQDVSDMVWSIFGTAIHGRSWSMAKTITILLKSGCTQKLAVGISPGP
jgi:hypothetical protein